MNEKEKPTTRAVIGFSRIYAHSAISRGSRNRTHIDGFGDHCSTFELCPYLVCHARADKMYNTTGEGRLASIKLNFLKKYAFPDFCIEEFLLIVPIFLYFPS